MADMFPVRVLIEMVRPQHCLSCSHDGHPFLDTYAIVSGHTVLGDLVASVLSALGLPQLVEHSRGLIQINNWKPLGFEAITDNSDEPVANLFKEIARNVTLKILTKRCCNNESNSQRIAGLTQRLFKMAIERQPKLFTAIDNHEVKEVIQQMLNSTDESAVDTMSGEQISLLNAWLDQIAHSSHQTLADRKLNKSMLNSTRFSPVNELPRLERWYRSDPAPSRQKLLNYMNILNSSSFRRRANNKVSYQQLNNWFAQKRTNNATTTSSNGSKKQQQLQQDRHNNRSSLPQCAGIDAAGQSELLTGTAPNTYGSLFQLPSSFGSSGNESREAAINFQQKLASFFNSATMNGSGCTATTQQQHQIPMAQLPPDVQGKFAAIGGASTASVGVEHIVGGDSLTTNTVGGTTTTTATATTSARSSSSSGHHMEHSSVERIDGGSNTPESTVNGGCGELGMAMIYEEEIDENEKNDDPSPFPDSLIDGDDVMPIEIVKKTQTVNMKGSSRRRAIRPQHRLLSRGSEERSSPIGHHNSLHRTYDDSLLLSTGGGSAFDEQFPMQKNENAFDVADNSAAAMSAANAAMISMFMQQQQQHGLPTSMANGASAAGLDNVGMNFSTTAPASSAGGEATSTSLTAAIAASAFQSSMMMAMANAAAMSAAGATNNRLQQAQQTPPRSLTQSPLFLNGSNQGGGFFRFPSSTFETNNENVKIEQNGEQKQGHDSNTRPQSNTSSGCWNGMNGGGENSTGAANGSASSASATARSRLMFDPLSELPILERWFEENPHPGWLQIEQFTETLNSFPYRQNYPSVSTHNVKIWFKNRRAKCKRLQT